MLEAYPPDLQEFVQRKIASGAFRSADEFAVEAALLYREMDRRREELRAKVAAATAQIKAGEYIDIDGDDELREFFEDVKRRGRERLAQAAHVE